MILDGSQFQIDSYLTSIAIITVHTVSEETCTLYSFTPLVQPGHPHSVIWSVSLDLRVELGLATTINFLFIHYQGVAACCQSVRVNQTPPHVTCSGGVVNEPWRGTYRFISMYSRGHKLFLACLHLSHIGPRRRATKRGPAPLVRFENIASGVPPFSTCGDPRLFIFLHPRAPNPA